MKDSIIGTVIYYIFMIAVLLLSISLFIFSIGVIPPVYIMSLLETYYDGTLLSNIITAVVSILFIIVSIRLMLPGRRHRKLAGALVKNTELGEIQVSLDALNHLAHKAATKFDDIKDINSNIKPDIDGISVQLKLMLMPDVEIPDLTRKVQNEVKTYIESLSGIHVKEVRIFVDNLTHTQTARVE